MNDCSTNESKSGWLQLHEDRSCLISQITSSAVLWHFDSIEHESDVQSHHMLRSIVNLSPLSFEADQTLNWFKWRVWTDWVQLLHSSMLYVSVEGPLVRAVCPLRFSGKKNHTDDSKTHLNLLIKYYSLADTVYFKGKCQLVFLLFVSLPSSRQEEDRYHSFDCVQ